MRDPEQNASNGPKAEAGFAPSNGSEAWGPAAVALWFRYLKETDSLESYEGTCPCYACKRVRDGFDAWKAQQEQATKPQNGPDQRPGANT